MATESYILQRLDRLERCSNELIDLCDTFDLELAQNNGVVDEKWSRVLDKELEQLTTLTRELTTRIAAFTCAALPPGTRAQKSHGYRLR